MRRVAILLLVLVPSVSLLHSREEGGAPRPVVARETATLKGKVVLTNNYNAVVATLDKNLAEAMKKSTDCAACMAGPKEETTQQTYRIGDNKQLGNVFVWLEPAKGWYFPIDERQVARARSRPIVIDQPRGAFVPHCAIHFVSYPDPKSPRERLPTGQTFTVLNSAAFGHNVRWYGKRNPGNSVIVAVGKKTSLDLEPDVLPVSLECNIHPWMYGKVKVVDHPYATLTCSDTGPAELKVKAADPKFGTYEIKGVPADVPLVLFAWHEKIGWLHKGNRSTGEPIQLTPGDNVRDFDAQATLD